MSLASSSLAKTGLLFHRDGDLHKRTVQLQSVIAFDELDEQDQSLVKLGTLPTSPTHAVIVDETIFHPQGGGQPSDVGIIKIDDKTNFEVSMVRHATTNSKLVLHFGHFPAMSDGIAIENFTKTLPVSASQEIDADKRVYYSKLHTAGHVLGASVRKLLEAKIDGFDELKASHFPDSAACEFKGLIQGSEKDAIQKQINEYIDAKMPVEIEYWNKDDFRKRGLDRLLPSDEDWAAIQEEDETIRVVNIVGAEVYPCGGTHVHDTGHCKGTRVRKIGRSKGTSRVAYAVDS